MAPLIIIGLLVFMLVWMFATAFSRLQRMGKSILAALTPAGSEDLFNGNYIDVKVFYTREFGQAPCISYMGNIDTKKVFDYIHGGHAGEVTAAYQRNWYNWSEGQLQFEITIFKLADKKILVEVGEEYVYILFDRNNYSFADTLAKVFAGYKAPEKEEEYEINIITFANGRLGLKRLEIKPAPLDIDLYYNDDFKPVDAIIKDRLAKENDKGIVLLYGLPGTGKTTYLRHLIGSMKKKVLFVSPGVAGNLMNPEFVDLLIDNPNAVLVIEDAENIIMDRKYNSDSSVSNLLNISDGLMSDCLNVQVICTFNSALNRVDDALLRKGRLIAKYEFGKLSVGKSRRLSAHLGLEQVIHQPMTLAEITNPEETNYKEPKVRVIGFRREMLEN